MRRGLLRAGALAALLTGSVGTASGQAPFDEPEVTGSTLRVLQPEARAAARPTHAPMPAARRAAAVEGQYGGGFIELLITGREPIRPLRPAQPAPALPEERFIEPSLGRPARVSGLPAAPVGEAVGIGRTLDPGFRRQVVAYNGPYRAGTIVIDTPAKYLYLVQPGGTAIRYGIGVGRPGFEWAGVKMVTRKAEWPDWRPPAQMLKRRPDLPRHMEGGPDNPLGARALYLGSSLYRIHGTNEPHTIGHAVSSGCIRMMNQDVIDLYNQVGIGTKVVVL